MKIAPILDELESVKIKNLEFELVHTGQHYDDGMSEAFFRDLELRRPDIYLGVGHGSHAEQTARVMVEFEKVCQRERPDLVVVVGDVNSTLASALVAAKLCIPIAHVEAGLRSFDPAMPEEVNRVLTDRVSHYLFTTCEDASFNLIREGIDARKIHFVGNVMIDTLLKHKEKAERSDILRKLGLTKEGGWASESTIPYAVLTLHRPANVDDKKVFKLLLEALNQLSQDIPIYFPAHPRTQKRIDEFGFSKYFNPLGQSKTGLFLIEPLGYLDFLQMMAHAKVLLTDSGGIQEETTILGVACITLRENTERPVTISEGTNVLVGRDPERILTEGRKALANGHFNYKRPKLWDGKAAQRVVKILLEKT